MVDIPITRDFNNGTGVPMIGYARFDDDSMQMIQELLESGVEMQFNVGFVGDKQEDGTYKNVELTEISMSIAGEQTELDR